MQAKLKEFYCLDFDLNSYWPEETDNFSFWVRAMIGPDDGEGAESFDIQVCTPKWLQAKYSEEETLFGRHMLIVFEYDLERIKQKISKYCAGCSGENWQELANKLGRIGHWEFEDYKPA